MALKGLGLNGKILLSAYTCIRVPEAILAAGCEPVFVDLSESGVSFDPSVLGGYEPGELCAIIITHLWGCPVHMEKILSEARRIGAIVIEDCALSLGTSPGGHMVGTSGALAIFSFGRGKTLNLGGGGALVVNDASLLNILKNRSGAGGDREVALLQERVKTILLSREMWRAYFPWLSYLKYWKQGSWLWESVITEPHPMECSGRREDSIFLRLLSLVDIGNILEHKAEISEIYQKGINETSWVRSFIPKREKGVICPSYPLIVQGRDELFLHLRKQGVDCGLSFSYSAGKVCSRGVYPEAERVAERILTLPVHEGVTIECARKIVSLINEWIPPVAQG